MNTGRLCIRAALLMGGVCSVGFAQHDSLWVRAMYGTGNGMDKAQAWTSMPSGSRGFRSEHRRTLSLGAVCGTSLSSGGWGFHLGPSVDFSPLDFLGLRATACYVNDNYLFFRQYRVNGACVEAGVEVRYGRTSIELGPNLDYYFAPIVDRSFGGWHAGVGFETLKLPRSSLRVSAGYLNRVNPWSLLAWEFGWPGRTPLQLLLCDMPKAYVELTWTWRE
jgi:hypothetical protein